jgi:hypothetical protein
MNMKKVMEKIKSYVSDELDTQELEFNTYPWKNYTWKSNLIRYSHLEYYETDKVKIIHLVLIPNKNNKTPIYGFDMIEIAGNLTGIFLDLTPVDDRSFHIPKVGIERPLPEWADFFSENFLCIKPNSILDSNVAFSTLDLFFRELKSNDSSCVINYTDKHNKYMTGQRKNKKTLMMLSSHIGPEAAKNYFETILFPFMEE